MSRILEALRRAEEDRRAGASAEQLALPDILQHAAPPPPPLPEFAHIPYHASPAHVRVRGRDGEASLAEERFRLLRYRLESWRRQQPLTTLLISSAVPSEGKTVVATNLAETLAQGPGRVLLIDADLRRPGVNRALGLPFLPGLAEVLQSGASWRDSVHNIDSLGFCFLASGRMNGSAAELLQSRALRAILTEAAQLFDWVVIDSPPLLPFADTLYLAEASHGIVLVAREDVTPAADLQKAVKSLSGFPLIGVVLNAVRQAKHDRYYYSYYTDSSPRKETAPAAEAPAA